MAARVLMVATDDRWFVLQHMTLARLLIGRGYDVHVAVARGDMCSSIANEPGLTVHHFPLLRRSLNPLTEGRAVSFLAGLYRAIRPDLLHHIGMKPIVYGSMAARAIVGTPIINAFTGFGYAFTSRDWKARMLRAVLAGLLPGVLAGSRRRVVVENADDKDELVNRRLASADKILVIPTGFDDAKFAPLAEPAPPVTAAYVGRMLRDKGVHDAVAAMKLLRSAGSPVVLLLAGEPDPGNPTSIERATLQAWHADGLVEYLGYQSNIPALWARAHIAILPSYREGLPVSVLEAAACGRPCIATDVPGCRSAVVDGQTGVLVPAGDPEALRTALARLAEDHALRRAMGLRAIDWAAQNFGRAVVTRKMLALYEELVTTIPDAAE